MASTSNVVGDVSQPVVFTTQSPYPLPSQKFMIPASWRRYQLSQLINKALGLPKPVPFDFLVRGEVLRGSLGEWGAEHGAGEEETLEIEYIESVMPPQKMSSLPHEDWVSSVSCEIPGHFLTASYDGHIRAFDYSQTLVQSAPAHTGPITSLCYVPSRADAQTHLVASASHDLTARLTRLSLAPVQTKNAPAEPLASLHLHTAPLASIASNVSGSHLLTASWDGLIGLWDTVIPETDEVPHDETDNARRKRRKVARDEVEARRKAPVTVLKSHTARVSKAVFSQDGRVAYSCGFDSTVRTWDVDNGICTHTITAPEKPMLDLALTSDGHTALAASTDRTISLYDLRASTSSSTPAVGALPHPATPSCIAPSPNAATQVVSGAYDGVVRVWDLRSMKTAMASFRPWEKGEKVLAVDWVRGVVGVGGEGGMEIWRVGEADARIV